VPGDTPPAVPLDEPIVAMPVLPLLHVPPGEASVRVLVLPWQIDKMPVMVGGRARTVTVVVLAQPVPPV
jgi:hypothetical protein